MPPLPIENTGNRPFDAVRHEQEFARRIHCDSYGIRHLHGADQGQLAIRRDLKRGNAGDAGVYSRILLNDHICEVSRWIKDDRLRQPGVGGPFTLLIGVTWPFAKSRLKLSMTAEPWLGTTTKPLEEDEYLVPQAIRTPINTSARIATIQVSLVRILRFISYERAYVSPAAANRVVNTV